MPPRRNVIFVGVCKLPDYRADSLSLSLLSVWLMLSNPDITQCVGIMLGPTCVHIQLVFHRTCSMIGTDGSIRWITDKEYTKTKCVITMLVP